MAKTKNKLTKLDIARWAVVLPVTIILLLVYGEFSSWLNKIYLMNFHVKYPFFTIYIDCIVMPLIVIACGYFISPKFKFRSTLILVTFFVLTVIYSLLTNEYLKYESNPFILLYLITASLGLYGIYQIESKK
jgi:hypothetical protein